MIGGEFVRILWLFSVLMFAQIGFSKNFEDDFNRGASEAWQTYGDGFAVSDQAYTVSAGNGTKALIRDLAPHSFSYEADVTVGPSGNAGLVFRAQNAAVGQEAFSGYYAGIDAGRKVIEIGAMNNNWKELAALPHPIAAGRSYRLKVEQKGSHIDFYLDGEHLAGVVDRTHGPGRLGLRTFRTQARFDNVRVTDLGIVKDRVYDWSWVKGAVFVPSNVVNEAQQWEEFDPVINDRELAYAAAYGFNLVRVFLHFAVWQKHPETFLNNIETFLQLADKHGIKTEFVFFDDVWDPNPVLGPYPAPIPGVHNSRWVQSPGDFVKDNYAYHREQLEAYVKDVVSRHAHDPRISFWETFNEPGNGQNPARSKVTQQLMNEARLWIKETESSIPVTATGGNPWLGEPFSDFYSWHFYEDYSGAEGGAATVCTETMNRRTQTVSGVVDYLRGKTGYVLWELMIGRDNCRFPWGNPPGAPEPEVPFHGLIYPDGHPWSLADVKAVRGDDLQGAPFFAVTYYTGKFQTKVKSSITPFIDFDLGNESGTGSPDASAKIGVDHWSQRWRGKVTPAQSGEHLFYIDSDGVASLSINGQEVVKKTSKLRQEVSGSIALEAGRSYDVAIEYEHESGDASMHVKWSAPQGEKKVLRGENFDASWLER